MKIFKYLYLNNSVFYGATIVAIAYILAFFFPILMSFASILLLVLALFTFVDVLLLFLTKVPLKAQRILPEKLSNGDENFEKIDYNYFNVEPILEEEEGTYADKEAPLNAKTITWNHPISEVLNALIQNGLVINCFNEFDYSPYNCFNQTEEFEPNKFRIKHLENKIPMVYSLSATKK